jgi:hypothetical protein
VIAVTELATVRTALSVRATNMAQGQKTRAIRRKHMNTEHQTKRSETVLPNKTTELSLCDEALDHVVGGLNPQPLPPGIIEADKASPKFSWGM